jgi:hypothetical protein
MLPNTDTLPNRTHPGFPQWYVATVSTEGQLNFFINETIHEELLTKDNVTGMYLYKAPPSQFAAIAGATNSRTLVIRV